MGCFLQVNNNPVRWLRMLSAPVGTPESIQIAIQTSFFQSAVSPIALFRFFGRSTQCFPSGAVEQLHIAGIHRSSENEVDGLATMIGCRSLHRSNAYGQQILLERLDVTFCMNRDCGVLRLRCPGFYQYFFSQVVSGFRQQFIFGSVLRVILVYLTRIGLQMYHSIIRQPVFGQLRIGFGSNSHIKGLHIRLVFNVEIGFHGSSRIGYVDGQVAVIVTASHCAAESGSQNGCLQYVLFHDSSHFKCLFPSGIIG